MPNLTGDVAIVGGSLAGLATGIGLARAGIPVTVFEQNAGEERGGTGLGIEPSLIRATTGVNPLVDGLAPALPVVNEGYRDTSTWASLYRWLRAVAGATPGLTVHESTRIDSIASEQDSARLAGPTVAASASVIIGADGYRSLVRKTVAPQHPYAPYGGFLLWRGLVEESWLPERFLAQRSLGGGRLPHPETARLVVYRVPGPNGETAPGKRQITFAWYDATRTTWLRDRGYLLGNEVMASVPNGAIDADLHNQLRTLIATRWRGAAREVLTTAIAHKVIFGTPLAEYLPEQLVAGRVGIVGDAAHVASPMVGAGFSSGLVDGAVFIAAVKDCGGGVAEAGVEALRRYEKERLEPNRDRVLESHEQTLDLLRSTR